MILPPDICGVEPLGANRISLITIVTHSSSLRVLGRYKTPNWMGRFLRKSSHFPHPGLDNTRSFLSVIMDDEGLITDRLRFKAPFKALSALRVGGRNRPKIFNSPSPYAACSQPSLYLLCPYPRVPVLHNPLPSSASIFLLSKDIPSHLTQEHSGDFWLKSAHSLFTNYCRSPQANQSIPQATHVTFLFSPPPLTIK